MSLGSYSNNDAWGVFGKNYLFKKAGAFHTEKKEFLGGITKNILSRNATFLVGHNRLATQGDEKNNFNNHPFPTKDWVIVHNGVLSNDRELITKHDLDYKEETDSAVVVQILQKLTDNGVESVTAIKTVAEEIEGSYSICAYQKTEGRLFYFKNDTTRFSFRLFELRDGSRILTGSTDSTNLDKIYVSNYMIFAKSEYESFYETEPVAGVVYEITDKEIREVDSFTPKVKTTYYGSYYGKSGSTSGYAGKSDYYAKGGYYNDDWDGYEDWQGKAKRDIEYPARPSDIVPLDMLDKQREISEQAEEFCDELVTATGIDWAYDVDWRNAQIVMKPHDSPIALRELQNQLSDHYGVFKSKINTANNTIEIKFEDLAEAYS